MKIDYDYLNTPIGTLEIGASLNFLLQVRFLDEREKKTPTKRLGRVENSCLAFAKKELDEYFKGKRKIFRSVFFLEGSHFEKKIYSQLGKIPFGGLISYGELATLAGIPKASRAVGRVLNKNKLTIVLPCHRVIGRNGNLVGYAPGLEFKKWLIEHERIC
jgi:methylated-DNA-[protein]-cysteine S-methyltransferase